MSTRAKIHSGALNLYTHLFPKLVLFGNRTWDLLKQCPQCKPLGTEIVNYNRSTLPPYGFNLANSGVSPFLISSGQGDTSIFSVPGMHFSFFSAELGRLISAKNL